MSKELESLNDLINFIGNGEIADTHELCEYVAKRKDIIESALEEKEQQDSVLKIVKEVIEFATVLPHIDFNKDNDFNDIVSAVSINIQRDIENKERELLRKWVLETCFPKELKAFEIIKENLVVGYDESKNDKPCLTIGIKVDKDKLVIIYQTFDKEKIGLLREALK